MAAKLVLLLSLLVALLTTVQGDCYSCTFCSSTESTSSCTGKTCFKYVLFGLNYRGCDSACTEIDGFLYCCDSNLCNTASSLRPAVTAGGVLLLLSTFFLW
uniref:Uncharacterized protein n=1 Tax=Palpitomonas bilix TaxID=652834 RepID=A0A7S3LVU1_9EUKA